MSSPSLSSPGPPQSPSATPEASVVSSCDRVLPTYPPQLLFHTYLLVQVLQTRRPSPPPHDGHIITPFHWCEEAEAREVAKPCHLGCRVWTRLRRPLCRSRPSQISLQPPAWISLCPRLKVRPRAPLVPDGSAPALPPSQTFPGPAFSPVLVLACLPPQSTMPPPALSFSHLVLSS